MHSGQAVFEREMGYLTSVRVVQTTIRGDEPIHALSKNSRKRRREVVEALYPHRNRCHVQHLPGSRHLSELTDMG